MSFVANGTVYVIPACVIGFLVRYLCTRESN